MFAVDARGFYDAISLGTLLNTFSRALMSTLYGVSVPRRPRALSLVPFLSRVHGVGVTLASGPPKPCQLCACPLAHLELQAALTHHPTKPYVESISAVSLILRSAESLMAVGDGRRV